MYWKSLLTAAAAGTLFALSMSAPAAAFGRCNLLERSAGPDPYMWRYCKARYYPAAREMYWVPAKHMRYRWRYQYHGQKYVYHPAWGHPATSGVVAYEKRGYYYRWHLW